MSDEVHDDGALRLVRAPVAAAMLAVAVQTLAKWRVSGQGPRFRRFGRAVIYDVADLRAWVAAQELRSTSDAAGSSSYARSTRTGRDS
jgi:hypothetical protein